MPIWQILPDFRIFAKVRTSLPCNLSNFLKIFFQVFYYMINYTINYVNILNLEFRHYSLFSKFHRIPSQNYQNNSINPNCDTLVPLNQDSRFTLSAPPLWISKINAKQYVLFTAKTLLCCYSLDILGKI